MLKVLISAGEASGEMYGAALLDALRKLSPDPVEAFGLGGEKMRAAGCDIIVDSKDVAVVGIAEVVAHLPRIYGEFHKLLREADRRKPDVAVLIDFPDFHFRLAKALHARGIPVVYYVSPQLWAWRRGRIKLVQRYVKKMLVIFPFEEQFYREHNVEAEFTGHPLGELSVTVDPRTEFAVRYGLDPAKPWVGILPGSRRKEVQMILPTLIDAAKKLGPANEYLLPVASTLDAGWMQAQLLAIPQPPRVTLTSDARQTLVQSRAAMVASGTATVEASVLGTPFVMVYRVAPLSWRVGRRLVKLDRFAMPNLIAGREVVRELVQENFTADKVAAEVSALIEDGPRRAQVLKNLAEVREHLQSGRTNESAAERAARSVLSVAQRKD
ncbi:lipid-A-disaccharide synthase [Candidatus Koribacter versatilis Ellin345]|uniref:Lipid-A-disaccharide synthase n=1 Tax=Koribacter versatilis (strain Ellin345) TaxID=204669 RepID=LPXB_KORVE|nr:lipid-A-disaccharide synthase [Candidatus Koribacter versatilis]Q1INL4.1 RecName: Full=Lipid-A-disaccharide synthase [Candidatus Koribacter versatilis Ellin345]ABF41536.1 lipid-A-disaccharide synthase [Candidatus Koribacter versatilis Ellin345]